MIIVFTQFMLKSNQLGKINYICSEYYLLIMKIIIAGSGEVGSHLAKLLSYESQEITLIDSNDEKLTFPNSQLDIRVVQGDCTSISTLNKANVTEADLFIGVTAAEAVNLTACYLAKQLGAKKTIARISNPELKENEDIDFSNLGISELISPGKLRFIKVFIIDYFFFGEKLRMTLY